MLADAQEFLDIGASFRTRRGDAVGRVHECPGQDWACQERRYAGRAVGGRRLHSWTTAHGLPGRRRPAGRRIRWFPSVGLCQTTPSERLTASGWRLRRAFAFRRKKPLLQHLSPPLTFRRCQTVASRPELGSSARAKSAFAFLQRATWRLLARQASCGFDIGPSLEIAQPGVSRNGRRMGMAGIGAAGVVVGCGVGLEKRSGLGAR